MSVFTHKSTDCITYSCLANTFDQSDFSLLPIYMSGYFQFRLGTWFKGTKAGPLRGLELATFSFESMSLTNLSTCCLDTTSKHLLAYQYSEESQFIIIIIIIRFLQFDVDSLQPQIQDSPRGLFHKVGLVWNPELTV